MTGQIRQQSLLPEEPEPCPGAEAVASTETSLTSLAGKTVVAVDAHSLIYQVFHALPEMTSPHGEHVGAVYGFVRDLLDLIERWTPDRMVCAFDLPGPTFRHETYEAYKADRSEMPEELSPQITKIREVLDAMGILAIGAEGYEADDVLATIGRQCDEAAARCLIVTGDKDCRQLITSHVVIYNIRKQQIYDDRHLAEDWGIRPDQVVDFQALVGDKIDNVPGVPLIGPKIARELIHAYGTLQNVLDHAEEVAGAKRRQNLIEFREQALVSRRLVTLERHVDIGTAWAEAEVGPADMRRIRKLFRDYGFRNLGDRIQPLAGPEPALADTDDRWEADYRVVDSLDELRRIVAEARRHPCVSIDTETTDRSAIRAKLVGISLAYQPGEAFYFPFRAGWRKSPALPGGTRNPPRTAGGS